jgi:hypothetical protein
MSEVEITYQHMNQEGGLVSGLVFLNPLQLSLGIWR